MVLEPAVVIGAFGALVTAMTTVARFVYLDLRRDRDYWRSVALKLMSVNEKAIDAKALDV